MGLFNKKKEETNSCCCVGNCTPKTMAKTEASKSGVGVKVLGSGCVKCKTLENATREALVELGMDTTIDHVTDFSQIAAYGVDYSCAGCGRESRVLWQGVTKERS